MKTAIGGGIMKWWVWGIILVVAAAIVVPIKLKLLKMLLGMKRDHETEQY